MKIYAPPFYGDFRCAAGKCRHTCCAGWEIGVDPETAAYYAGLPGTLGQRLRENLVQDQDGASFRLTPEGHCPFWNSRGLCDVIAALGEEGLCQVCADHPRYRNFFSGRVEVGLGLCCEAAGRLTFNYPGRWIPVLWEDDGEEERPTSQEERFFTLRDRALALAQDRSLSLDRRIAQVLDLCGGKLCLGDTPSAWGRVFLSLERLDSSWTGILQNFIARGQWRPSISPDWDLPLEQLLCAFLYRHLAGGAGEGLPERSAFAALSFFLVRGVWACCLERSARTLEGLVEAARLYSGEVEYSEENMEALFHNLRKDDQDEIPI